MEISGSFRIAAPREKVWASLNDPEILKVSIPGCERIEKLSENEFSAKVTAKVGPVKASFGGKVTLSDLDPPQSYRISGEGSGGVAGFARGSARVRLEEAEEGATLLSYTVEAHVGGKLAQVGSRLVDAAAKKMAGDFFSRFSAAVAPEEEELAAPTEGEGAPSAEEGAAEKPVAPAPPRPSGLRLPPALWIPALLAVIALLLYFFAGRSLTR